MPRITYDRQLSPSTANVPSLPEAGKPSLVLSAINQGAEAVQGAAEQAGKIGQMLAKHAQEQQELKNQQVGQQVYSQYTRDMQDRLYNDQPETVKVNGQDVTRPAGILNRQLSQAQGSIHELDGYYLGQARNQYLDQIKDPQTRAKIAGMMDTHYSSLRGNVISHEATQGRKDLINTFDSSVKQQVNLAYDVSDPNALKSAIDNAVLTQHDLNRASGFDEATANLATQKTVSNVVLNSAVGILKRTGNIKEAQGLLDSSKDKLNPKDFGDIQDKLRTSAETIQKGIERTALMDKVQTRFDMINAVATGKMKWDNSADTIKKIALVDKDLAEAMQSVISSDGQYTSRDTTGADEEYQKMVNNVFSSSSNEEMGKFLIDAMNKAGNGQISRDRLAILVNAAQNRAKTLPPTDADGKSLPPTQIAIDGGMNAVLRWNEQHGNKDPQVLDDYMTAIHSNKSPMEAYQIATDTYKTKVNPAKSQYQIGQPIHNPKSGISGEVVGFDEKGSPLIRIKRGKPSGAGQQSSQATK